MALTKTSSRTKTSSIIKTRAQSRTGARTGTNVRTNDDTIAPAPVAVGTTGRTIGGTTHVAPVPVVTTTAPVDDLFAGRPTTGTLKDPPPAVPAPRDRDSDPDSDANKKPAAKPTKGRPKKVVAPKALLSTVLIRLGRCYTSSTSRLGMMSVSNPTMIL